MTISATKRSALVLSIGLLWQTGAAAQSSQMIDVEAQPLSAAIAEFAAETGVQISAATATTAGKTSSPVSGVMSPMEALRQILAGTDLVASQQANGTIVISQTAEPDESGIVVADEILVQGELQTRSVQDTLTSVAVITGEELEGRPASGVFDVIERTAGASLGANGESVVIRGVTAGGLGGGAPVITTSIDGARVDAGRFSGNALESTWDLQQIEVLRGPQSTQTGRNALAGAIVVRSADPVHDLEIKARAEIGNANTLEGAFAVNVPVIEDTLALRVSLDRKQTDGFVSNPTLGGIDVDDRADTTLRTSLLFEPSDNFSAIFKYTRIETDSSANGPPLQGALFPDNRINVASFPEREIGTFNAGNLRMSYDINDNFWIETETTLSESNTLTNTDLDFTALPLGIFINDQDVQGIEQEIKFLYEGDAERQRCEIQIRVRERIRLRECRLGLDPETVADVIA
ncbi:MAG: TonB-dependent receptor, partial [Pseudomonadota bacterium]